MTDASKFRDAFTAKGPLEAFLQPGSVVGFKRGNEICEGVATIESVDVKTKTIWFAAPLPAGIRPGDTLCHQFQRRKEKR